MSAIEIVAAILGVANVFLVARRVVWNYPIGLVMVALYAKIFFDARLYSDAALQIYFFLIQIYGWWNWSRGLKAEGDIVVETLTGRQRLYVAAGTLAASGAVGWLMATLTDAAAPWLDSLVAGMSVVAQWLMTQRKIENWVLWIAVDILAIGLFFWRGLYPTAALYVIFLCLAVWGLVSWRSALRRQAPPARP